MPRLLRKWKKERVTTSTGIGGFSGEVDMQIEDLPLLSAIYRSLIKIHPKKTKLEGLRQEKRPKEY